MNISRLAASVGLCFLAAFAGSIITLPSIPAWYAGLNKPFFSPPNWIFGPVWTVLYLLMGIALYLIWNKGLKNKNVRWAAKIFLVQLALNFAWSLMFFGFHSPLMAFLIIIVLWAMIVYAIYLFNKLSSLAALLLLPYILWVSFALILNLFIAILN